MTLLPSARAHTTIPRQSNGWCAPHPLFAAPPAPGRPAPVQRMSRAVSPRRLWARLNSSNSQHRSSSAPSHCASAPPAAPAAPAAASREASRTRSSSRLSSCCGFARRGGVLACFVSRCALLAPKRRACGCRRKSGWARRPHRRRCHVRVRAAWAPLPTPPPTRWRAASTVTGRSGVWPLVQRRGDGIHLLRGAAPEELASVRRVLPPPRGALLLRPPPPCRHNAGLFRHRRDLRLALDLPRLAGALLLLYPPRLERFRRLGAARAAAQVVR